MINNDICLLISVKFAPLAIWRGMWLAVKMFPRSDVSLRWLKFNRIKRSRVGSVLKRWSWLWPRMVVGNSDQMGWNRCHKYIKSAATKIPSRTCSITSSCSVVLWVPLLVLLGWVPCSTGLLWLVMDPSSECVYGGGGSRAWTRPAVVKAGLWLGWRRSVLGHLVFPLLLRGLPRWFLTALPPGPRSGPACFVACNINKINK